MSSNTEIAHINSQEFHAVVRKMREFFEGRGFVEVHTQSRLSILAACEDPTTISLITTEVKFGLCQTGQVGRIRIVEEP